MVTTKYHYQPFGWKIQKSCTEKQEANQTKDTKRMRLMICILLEWRNLFTLFSLMRILPHRQNDLDNKDAWGDRTGEG